jgi:phospholipid/cholesterol/gamma-HCH transport system substrate-binding protein
MNAKNEQALVGLFVFAAVVVMIGTVFTISGVFGRSVKTFHTYFGFAGGLEPGATVRYSGGMKAGRVEKLTIDPQDSSRIEVTFSVQTDLPVKTDSKAKIMSLSPLGENHLEIMPGSAKAGLAKDGALLPSEEYLDFNALTKRINDIAPDAQQLLHTLNDRATELKVTIERVNDLLNAQNRANLAGTLANARGMIEENRPQIKSTIGNLNTVSEKLQPLLEDFRKTTAEANKTLDHIDGTIGENREDVHKAVLELRRTLANTTALTGRLDQTLDVNSENIDQLLDNLRQISENLREFSATIKARPYSLIRSVNPPEHKPGEQP